MDNTKVVYLLVSLSISSKGDVLRKNVGATRDIHVAEAHASQDISNEYETVPDLDTDPQETSARTELVLLMRDYVAEVKADHAEAIR